MGDRDDVQAPGLDPPPARPEPDKVARAVARSRVAERLFATKEVVRIGRYHLLEKVGAGGMGVVWGAWDPELERRVAIKLLAAERESARERILAEGQALAKLSHPNVVPVFDVGVVDEQVYLVMEWVRGHNVRLWAAETPRSVRNIVGVYRAAGEGLAAAHAAGLVHRDFKPDNAVVGEDGRVRVLDFGLARSELVDAGDTDDGATRGAGTPRYMPPEQREGGELTGAADQYAFGVSLRETLAARGEVPAWIAAIVARATRPSPTDRFESMSELLAALARDPRTVWRRRILVGAALGLAVGAFAAGTLRGGDDEPPRCSGARAEIAGVWSAAQREPLLAHLRDLGVYGVAVAQQLGPDLDAYAERWATASRNACMAADAGELPHTRYEQNLGCLARARASLAAAHDVLVRADLSRLPDALLAARSLPDPQRCRLEAESSTVAPPSTLLAPRVAELANAVARARVLSLAIDPTAVTFAETTVRAASELGYLPLIARAELAHGTALLWQKQQARATAAFDRARSAAFSSGDLVSGVEAYARELFAVATSNELASGDVAAVIAARHIVEDLARGLGPTGAFARTLLLNNLGTFYLSRGDRVAARGAFDAAMADRPAVQGDTYELAVIVGNRALVEDDPQRRAALFAQERMELALVVGADHPHMFDARVKAAAYSDDAAAARQELHAVQLAMQRLHPELVGKFGALVYDMLWLAWDAGDMQDARRLEPKISNATDERNARILLQLADDPAGALRAAESHAAELAGGTPWQRWRAIDARLVSALALQRLGQRERARTTVIEVLSVARALNTFANTVFYKRRIARLDALASQLAQGGE